MMNQLDQGSLVLFRGCHRGMERFCRQALVLRDVMKNYQDGKVIVPDPAVGSPGELGSAVGAWRGAGPPAAPRTALVTSPTGSSWHAACFPGPRRFISSCLRTTLEA